MNIRKKIFAINGSAGARSSNEMLLQSFAAQTRDVFDTTIFNGLKKLPHFDPALSDDGTPAAVLDFREQIEAADAILVCTPEYIFSIPSGLKNAIEWCVSTTVFSNKPLGIITASAHGQKGHQELQLIMRTVMADFREETTLLVQGIKGKIDERGIKDEALQKDLEMLIKELRRLLAEK